jgi:hypothetical protein
MTNVIPMTIPPIKAIGEMSPETAKLVGKFVALNQHHQSSHGPMTTEKLVTMLLEDVAAAVRDGDSWQGAHMALVLCEHGYQTG